MADRNIKKQADKTLREAYEKYYASIYKFCLSKMKNDSWSVEDCVQEAFLVFYNRLLRGEEFEFVQAFLFKTASNLIKKRYAQLKKQEKDISLEEVKKIPSQSADIDDRLTFEEYSKMISDALSDTDREIFTLRYIEELSITEIANELGLTIKNVSTRLSRMRKRLREIIDNNSA